MTDRDLERGPRPHVDVPSDGSAQSGAQSGAQSRPDRRRWLGLVVVSLGVAMIIVDSTIVNVALPAIIRELSITSTDAQWVQESYTLVFAALLLSFGRVADRYGRRLLFLAGLVVFIVASVLVALGQNGPELIGARILQGVGGAAMLPTSLSIINAEFRGRDRGIAFAVWGSTIGGTAALGPLLGGWLTTSFSWRWAFGINVPLGVLVIIGLLLLVGESKGEDTRAGVDLGGALLSIVGFGGIVFALIEGRNYGWWDSLKPFSLPGLPWPSEVSPVPVSLAIGVLALVLFVIVELRRNRADQVVILDLQLFTITSFRNGNLAAAVVSLGEFGLLFSLPLWFQNVRGYSAFETGLALLPLAVGSFAASGLGAQVGARRGAAFVVRLGIVLEIVGIAAIGLFARADSAWWVTVPCLFVYGMGVGLATAQLTGVVLVDVPVAQSGQGSATQSTSRQLGSALGIAILGTVLFTSLGSNLTSALDGAPGPPAGQSGQLVSAVVDSAGAAIPSLGANPATAGVADAARVAFTDATRATAWVAVAFLLLGLAVSFSLGRTSGRHED